MVTPICEVPVPVVDGVIVPKATLEPVAPAQLVLVIPEVPVQKVKDSSTEAVTVIWLAVETAIVPVSNGVAQPESEYVVIRR